MFVATLVNSSEFTLHSSGSREEAPESLASRFSHFDSTEAAVVPPVPDTLEHTGVPVSLIEQLMLKHLYFRGEVLGRDLAGLLGLQFSLIDEVLETMKRQHHVGVKKSLGMGNSSAVFFLTESGRNLTREYLENN